VRPPFSGPSAQGAPRAPAATPLRPAAGVGPPHHAAAPITGQMLPSRPYFLQHTGQIQVGAVMPQRPLMPQTLAMPQAWSQNAARKHKSNKKKTVPPTVTQGGAVLTAGAQSLG
jgi:hypothetical protein